MSKAKLIRLMVAICGATLALGGCAGGSWLPWVVGVGVVTLLGQQG